LPAYAPLVLALHGGGGDMRYMARDGIYGLISKSNAAKFIAVFPNGYSRLASGKLATWNAGTCCGAARDNRIDDTGFLKSVVADVKRRISVDSRRVFAIGMSNGGLMSYRLACEAPEVFRGIMGVAGTDNTLTCTPRRPAAILHIHAIDDDHVPFYGGVGPAGQEQINFVSVPSTIKKWVGLNACSARPVRVLSVAGAYCDVHYACAGGVRVKLCVTADGGHSWPGATFSSSGAPPSTAIKANDVMWDFFSKL
jgi:polyhydroxybutyrate depolymerase